MNTIDNGKLPIIKTESQLKSFIHRHTIENNDVSNNIFLDGKKVIEQQKVFTNWERFYEFKRVIAIYLPRKKG